MRAFSFVGVLLLGLVVAVPATAQQQAISILNFESGNPVSGNSTSHAAKVSAVNDVPDGGGRFSVRTDVDRAAGANKFFGTGFRIPPVDLSSAKEVRFGIKTDIEGGFNFQLHSDPGGASIFPFTTVGSAGAWKQVTAPMAAFKKPPWAKGEADLTRVNRVQLTAFGGGPYDGKFVMLDSVVSDGGKPVAEEPPNTINKARAARLREPVIVERGESVAMFDGKTLGGWIPTPRVYVPREERFKNMPANQLYDAVIEHYESSEGVTNRVPDRRRVKNKGVWTVDDGVVTGGQVPGSIAGSYLMSERKYGDFELTLEANPDYPIDTGIMVRAHRIGSVGYQVLVDNRPNGTIGGVYGNSVGGFFAYPFVMDADEEPLNRIANIRGGDPNVMKFSGGQFKTDFAATLEEFKGVWKLNDWNEIKIRCTGRLPLIETWINGVPIAKIDTATLADQVPGYDPQAILARIGREGHIGLEVHDSPTRDRWAPGAKCRWRNVRIRELVCEEKTERTNRRNITLSKIDGRHWLIDADGNPFFAHGITHVGNNRSKFSFDKISVACKALGFNAYGYGCPEPLRGDMPFIESWNHLVPISTYRGKNAIGFVDVFDPAEQAKLDRGVKMSCQRAMQNPRNVIGYCWTDLGAWPLDNPTGRNWVDFIRELPKDAPGRQAYEQFLREWEGDDEKARDQAFLRRIAREYFRVIGGANRKYDPDHLIFGDRFAFNTLDPDVVEEMLPWVDAIAIQPQFWSPFPKQKFDEIYKLTGKPILICDFAIRFKDGDKDVRMYQMAADSVAAGVAYSDYVKAALATDYILGVFWCNPIDTPKGFNKPGVKQGFFGDGLTERPGLHQSVRALNAYRREITPERVGDRK